MSATAPQLSQSSLNKSSIKQKSHLHANKANNMLNNRTKCRGWQLASISALFCLPLTANAEVLPLSDQQNLGKWKLNTEVSDEFNDDTIDEERWYIVGKLQNGKPVYQHPDKPNKKVWKGRAPSQFSGQNYRLEDGKLILETRWEPDFPFEKEIHKPVFGDALKYENLTTACFIGRKEFKYGYIEIKSKAADAEVSSAFWAMGERLEIDFYEQFGDAKDPNKDHLDNELWWSIRDWSTLVKGKPTYTERKDLGFRVADDFHVYGFEWDESGVKYYVDGKLFSEVSAQEVTKFARENREVPADYDGYVAVRPISLWLDQETFPWHGVPESKADLERNSPQGKKDDGIVDYEIDYVRVWQK
jgi:beta-glucanase (GH16 family)